MKIGGTGIPESVPHVRTPKITLKPAKVGFTPPENPLEAKPQMAVKPRMPANLRLKKEKMVNPGTGAFAPKPVPGYLKYRGIHE